jgi:hypothetical protein
MHAMFPRHWHVCVAGRVVLAGILCLMCLNLHAAALCMSAHIRHVAITGASPTKVATLLDVSHQPNRCIWQPAAILNHTALVVCPACRTCLLLQAWGLPLVP